MFTGGTGLTEITISYAVGITGLNVTSYTALTYLDCSGSALTQVAVDAILAKLDIAGLTGGAVYASDGTNSTPSAAGLTSKANLVGKDWTVTNN